ncbi:YajG family lipoprotein [Microbulbifer sp. 2304DJ12-6]|uniref:YajG family lipoprotein n=1 Tax=Microbulbifer sp. 2304DJ12-6 TaxID=3233340 RepID=UPI0039B10465
MKKLWLLAGVLALASCAYSPLQIQVYPEFQVTADSIGAGHTLSVQGINELPGGGLGSLGGVYSETSRISVANDAGEAIATGLRRGFANWSFRVTDTAAQVQVVARLVRLTYNSPDIVYTTTIDTSAEIHLEVKVGAATYFGTYSASGTDRNLVKPSREEVETRVNGILGATLQRVFEDRKLKDFLYTHL